MRIWAIRLLGAALLATGPVEAQSQVLRPPFSSFMSTFGRSMAVSVDGTTLAVATGCAEISACGSGWVSLYSRNGATWSPLQHIRSPRGDHFDRFAWDVALSHDGSRLVVSDVTYPGRAYVFDRSGDTWELTATLETPESLESDGFGTSLALTSEGTTAFVGAHSSHCPLPHYCGAVYVYVDQGGDWELSQVLRAPNPADSDVFGLDLAVAGRTLLVGAPGRNCAVSNWCGAVLVYGLRRGAWMFEQELSPPTPRGGEFGLAIAIAPNARRAIVGAPWAECPDPLFNQTCGRAYVLEARGNRWSIVSSLTPPNPRLRVHFGNSVAIDAKGDTVLVSERCPECPTTANAVTARMASARDPRRGFVWEQAFTTPGLMMDWVVSARVALLPDRSLAMVGVPWGEEVYVFPVPPAPRR